MRNIKRLSAYIVFGVFGLILLLVGSSFINFRSMRFGNIFQKVGEAAPEMLDKAKTEVKFNLEPGITVSNAITASPKQLESVPASKATGPLRVSQVNPRYFTDDSGKAIYLTGSHTWSNLQDNGGSNPPPVFDYTAYLDFLVQNNHNFFRLWSWEQSRWTLETQDDNYWFYPLPYQRTGPGDALDGQPKYDLTKFNQAYFDRMRERIIEAGNRGVYVSIMLFDGWSIEKAKGQYSENNPWHGHPFNKNNNINGIDGDPNGNDSGEETQTLDIPAVTAIQEAYVKKVIDTVNDLDNVLYEISNESNNNSEPWQYHMINFIKSYEAGKPKQHPVGMTAVWPGGYNPDLFNSPADWISPNNSDGTAMDDPPATDGTKVVLADTDHLCGICGDRVWVWKSFTRGENPIFMDGYDGAGYGVGGVGFNFNDPQWVSLRKNLGYTLAYANRMNLIAMQPRPDLVSTRFCLANPSSGQAEYLIYLPSGGNVTVDLSETQGDLAIEWFNPGSGETTEGGKTTGGGNRSFTAPFIGDAVLYLTQVQTVTPTAQPTQSVQPTPTTQPTQTTRLFLPIVDNEGLKPPPTSTPPGSTGAFLETFDGNPDTPQPWSSPNWDIQVQSRDVSTWLNLEPMEAAHGPNCEPPPATHPTNGNYAEAVFNCHDHVMTAINAGGYGVIYLTPNQMVNFSSGEAVVRFDLSTLRTSHRDWVDLWITPFADNLALPLDLPVDLQGAPRNAVQIVMDFGDSGVFKGFIYKNFQQVPLPVADNRGYEQLITPSAKIRSPFELHISSTHIKFGMPDLNLWWVDTDIPDLGWNTGVVQFGHHSYNPTKDCQTSVLACLPDTWHWDNVAIDPATSFTMIKANRRYVLQAEAPANQMITFDAPAPADSFLRFSGIGVIEVSLNGGPFQPAIKAQSSALPGIGDYHPEHLSNYWMPIPTGTKTVEFHFSKDDFYLPSYGMIAKDFGIWSLTGD